MSWLDLLLAVCFILLGSGCTAIVLIGLPGTWIMIALAFGITLLQRVWAPADSEWLVAWWVFVVAIVIAVVGEVLEFMAGALGAKKGGASKQGMFGALVGGFGGTILGCGVGAVIGELRAAPDVRIQDTIKPAAGAVVGRVLGAVAKFPCAFVVWVMLSVALVLEPARKLF